MRKNRPAFAYGRLIHEHCERRPHFDAGRFARVATKATVGAGCLYHLGGSTGQLFYVTVL